MAERVIVISGGSRGLGLELVRRFLAGGDRVATFSRSESEAVEALRRDPAAGQRLFYQPLAATDSAGVCQFVQAVGRRFGRIDALINNAGLAREGVLATMSDQAIREVVEVNLVGALLLTRECVRLMLAESWHGHPAHVEAPGASSVTGHGQDARATCTGGRIVSIASVVGVRGYAGLAAYSASKAGLIGMTVSLARELGPRNITVNAIAPGYLASEMTGGLDADQLARIVRRTPLGRLGAAGDVAGVVEFLLSEQARFVTGQTIVVDGGISC